MIDVKSRVSKLLLGAVLGAASIGSTGEAKADASCNVLLTTLRATFTPDFPEAFVRVHHTTNFLHPADPWTAYDTAILRLVNGHLTGPATRLFSDARRGLQPFNIQASQNMTHDIDPNGKITFDGVWGPFDPVCFGDRFMVFIGSDSIETFSFDVGPSIQ